MCVRLENKLCFYYAVLLKRRMIKKRQRHMYAYLEELLLHGNLKTEKVSIPRKIMYRLFSIYKR